MPLQQQASRTSDADSGHHAPLCGALATCYGIIGAFRGYSCSGPEAFQLDMQCAMLARSLELNRLSNPNSIS